jgi:hypothetical protein
MSGICCLAVQRTFKQACPPPITTGLVVPDYTPVRQAQRATLPSSYLRGLRTPMATAGATTLHTPNTITPLRNRGPAAPRTTASIKSTILQSLLGEWQDMHARMQHWLVAVQACPPPRAVHATAHESWLRQCQALEAKESGLAAEYEQAGGLVESEADATFRAHTKDACLKVLHATDPSCGQY